MIVETMKVKPWGEGQGDFVEINKTDFDPEFHVAFDEEKPSGEKPARKPRASKV